MLEPLSVTHPQLADEAHGWDPKLVTKGIKKKLEWKCARGHIYLASVVHRTNKKNPSGCPVCTNRKIVAGFNDLATLFPSLATEANDWDPTFIGAGSSKIVSWKCPNGHTWDASVIQRTSGGYKGSGTNCPFCTGAKTLMGFNDLATTHPEIAKEAHGWNPSQISAGSSRKLEWRCKAGHLWLAIVNSRTRDRSADCPYCTNRKVLVGFNDLATTDPEIAGEADGWDPTTVTRGMDKTKKWKCSEGHKWSTGVIVRSRGSGCPSCAKTGYDPNEKGYLYFIQHSSWNMYQIGITNDLDTRMNSHRKLGWELVQLRGPMDGLLAKEYETSILRMLRKRGAELGNTLIAGKFDGFSEAWTKDSYEVSSISELLNAVEEFENGK